MAEKRLLVLMAHEPNRDPRIDWVSRFATNLFQVTVHGISEPSRPELASAVQHGYSIERHQRSLKSLPVFAYTLVRCFAFNPLLWLMLLTGLFFLPFFLIFWLPAKILQAARQAAQQATGWMRKIANVIRRRLNRPLWLIRYFLTTAVTLYRELHRGRRPDLIYCNDLDTLLAGVLLRWYFGCKLIYDAHEFWAHSDPASPRAEVNFFLFYERQLLAHVDAAYTVNHLLAEQMHAALGHEFASLPNCEPLLSADEQASGGIRQGVVAASMKPVEPGSSNLAQIAAGRVRFLFQGGFAPERGIPELLAVWRHVDPGKAVLLLRGPDNDDKTACQKLAREFGLLDHNVFFPESVREQDLVPAAAEADVGVIPYKAATINYRYCCPNKLSQYMKAGLAILANKLDFVSYAIQRFQCGLTYDVNDPHNFLAAINRFIDDASFRHFCQQQARKMFVQEYHWENVSQSLYLTCARLTEQKPRRAEDESRVVRAA